AIAHTGGEDTNERAAGVVLRPVELPVIAIARVAPVHADVSGEALGVAARLAQVDAGVDAGRDAAGVVARVVFVIDLQGCIGVLHYRRRRARDRVGIE